MYKTRLDARNALDKEENAVDAALAAIALEDQTEPILRGLIKAMRYLAATFIAP